MDEPRTTRVGPFPIVAAPRRRVVELLVDGAASDRTFLAFHLHVAALTMTGDRDFVSSIAAADLVYADGASVVWLARLGGADQIERSPTTDVAHDVIDGVARRRGGIATIALVGGPEGLADRAAEELRRRHPVRVAVLADGFRSDWSPVLDDLRRGSPDIIFVGMGTPTEMLWSLRYRTELPSALVMTCGGWFGHVVGHERRAPRWAQEAGLEWMWRLVQDPRRLLGRYVRGLIAFLSLAARALARRRSLTDSRQGAQGDADD